MVLGGEKMSEIMTKRALEQALKSVLKTKNLKKVTIQDIADECGINRNTFYYHFKDIYDLVEWICIEDGKKALSQYRQYDNWENGTIGLLNMMLENKAFVENVYRNVGRERMESFLFPQIKQVIASIVYEEAEGISVTDEEKEFAAEMYQYIFVGVILRWIHEGMKDNPDELVGKLAVALNGSMKLCLKNIANAH